MAATEVRRAIVGRIPDGLRNCVNKEYFMNGGSFGDALNGAGSYNYTGPIVPHSTTAEPLPAPGTVSGNSVNASHSTPHSTLQESANHLMAGVKSENNDAH